MFIRHVVVCSVGFHRCRSSKIKYFTEHSRARERWLVSGRRYRVSELRTHNYANTNSNNSETHQCHQQDRGHRRVHANKMKNKTKENIRKQCNNNVKYNVRNSSGLLGSLKTKTKLFQVIPSRLNPLSSTDFISASWTLDDCKWFSLKTQFAKSSSFDTWSQASHIILFNSFVS